MNKQEEILNYSISCNRCNGDGKINGKDCPVCGGSGAIIDNMIAEVVKKAFNETRSMSKDTIKEFFKKACLALGGTAVAYGEKEGTVTLREGDREFKIKIDVAFELDRILWPRIVREIMNHFGKKLVDCYNRGIRDGIEVKKEAEEIKKAESGKQKIKI